MNDIPTPETITKVDLLLSANHALLCEVRPNMRMVSVEYIKEKKKIVLYFYYDSPPSQDELDYDVFGTISAEMSTYFPLEIQWEEKVIVIPYPNRLPNVGIPVYRRYEPSPEE